MYSLTKKGTFGLSYREFQVIKSSRNQDSTVEILDSYLEERNENALQNEY